MRRAKGTGSVVRIKGKYLARIRIGSETHYGPARASADEAEHDRLKWQKQPERPKPRSECPTLAGWALEQLEGSYGASIAPATWNTNEVYRKHWINASALARKRLHQITRADCQAFVDSIVAVRRRKVDGEIVETRDAASPRYIRRVAAFVSKLFSLAVRDRWIDDNPMEHVALPRVDERENRILEPQEALRLMNPSTRAGAMLLIAMHCGLRRSELAGLEWKHLDARKKILTVPGTKNAASRGRVVPLTQEAFEALSTQPRRGNFIFSTEAGGKLRPDNITRDVRAAMRAIGIPSQTRLHDLRGSFISMLLEHGADVRTVMEMVGHRDPRTTLKAYARSNVKAKQEAIGKLGKALRKGA